MPHLTLGILASHRGTTLQAIIDACENGSLDAEVAVVISNNSNSMALDRAGRHGIKNCHMSSVTHPQFASLDEAILSTLREAGVNLVPLAGYMRPLGPRMMSFYGKRILNVHPSLLPRHGGKGMYGDRVHEAVLQSGDPFTGATVHFVEVDYDTGPMISQVKVAVEADDTVEALRERVQRAERSHYLDVLRRIARGEITVGV